MGQSKRRHRAPDWPDWFEPRNYPHFDQPIRDPAKIRGLVESPQQVAKRAFLPFIHFEKTVRKYKRELGQFVRKPRPLSYESHVDAQVFRRYCQVLSSSYEELLCDMGMTESVLAYRRFKPPKCNIHFANTAFCFIEQHAPCVAMAFDVKDFFESLEHSRLKEQWRTVLKTDKLPSDHYAIFKAITRYAWVDRGDLFRLFGITKKKLSTWRGPICTPAQFRDLVRTSRAAEGLIGTKRDGRGVPQGSPISALLSNVYMIPVDQRLEAMAKELGGLYYRYIDDVLFVCPLHAMNSVRDGIRTAMEGVGLQVHEGPGKATIATFNRAGPQAMECDRPLQYLGFTFDGKQARVRSQTVARYMRRMRKAVRREKYIAECRGQKGTPAAVRRKGLYSQFTHLGTRNFISYARKASESISNNNIGDQVKHHWRDLHAQLSIE